MKRAIVVLSIAMDAIVIVGWLPRSTPPCGCCSPTCRTSISIPAGSAKSAPQHTSTQDDSNTTIFAIPDAQR